MEREEATKVGWAEAEVVTEAGVAVEATEAEHKAAAVVRVDVAVLSAASLPSKRQRDRASAWTQCG